MFRCRKKQKAAGLLIGLFFLTSPLTAQKVDRAEVLLECASKKELVDGDLQAAIEQYRKIVADSGSNRAIAAKALLRMAACFQKLGDAESRKIYERIVREYADQKEAAAQARTALYSGAQSGRQMARSILKRPGHFESNLHVSHDGRYLAFPDWESGNLLLHEISTGIESRLTTGATWEAPAMAWVNRARFSPDGRQVAFNWCNWQEDRCEVRVIRLQTTGPPSPRSLFRKEDVSYVEQGGWSPGNRFLLGTLHRYDKSRQIVLIAVPDGPVLPLKSGSEEDGLTAHGFSPDGNYILFTRRDSGGPHVYLMTASGNPEVPLVSGPATTESPVCTPDGRRVLFVSDRGGSAGLWSVRVADGKPLGEPELLKSDFHRVNPVEITRDGTLFYTQADNRMDIYAAGVDSSTGRLLSDAKRVNERSVGNSFGRVAWLPDGKSLSFRSRQWGLGEVLRVHSFVTGKDHDVPGSQTDHVGWFPDGRSFMAVQSKDQNQTHIFRKVDGQTGEVKSAWTVSDVPRQSIGFSGDFTAAFLPRKDMSIPCEPNKDPLVEQICTYLMIARDLQTGMERKLFRFKAGFAVMPVISPDGKEMAFVIGNEEGKRSLMLAPTAGGPPRKLQRNLFFTPLSWSGDGSHVLALNAFYSQEAL